MVFEAADSAGDPVVHTDTHWVIEISQGDKLTGCMFSPFVWADTHILVPNH